MQKKCKACCVQLERGDDETDFAWRKREFCGRSCLKKHVTMCFELREKKAEIERQVRMSYPSRRRY